MDTFPHKYWDNRGLLQSGKQEQSQAPLTSFCNNKDCLKRLWQILFYEETNIKVNKTDDLGHIYWSTELLNHSLEISTYMSMDNSFAWKQALTLSEEKSIFSSTPISSLLHNLLTKSIKHVFHFYPSCNSTCTWSTCPSIAFFQDQYCCFLTKP
jgi:hypothetical protein